MKIYIIYLVFMSLLTLLLFAVDKKRARKNEWRITEKMLLLMMIAGGSIGGLIGIYVIRHKSKHWYFILTAFLSLIAHLVILYFLIKYNIS